MRHPFDDNDEDTPKIRFTRPDIIDNFMLMRPRYVLKMIMRANRLGRTGKKVKDVFLIPGKDGRIDFELEFEDQNAKN